MGQLAGLGAIGNLTTYCAFVLRFAINCSCRGGEKCSLPRLHQTLGRSDLSLLKKWLKKCRHKGNSVRAYYDSGLRTAGPPLAPRSCEVMLQSIRNQRQKVVGHAERHALKQERALENLRKLR